jgi:hypothetical protein
MPSIPIAPPEADMPRKRPWSMPLIALLLLAACAGPRPAPEDGPGTDRGDENSRYAASCTRACNREHAVCMDSRIAREREREQSQFRGDPSCDNQIRQCLARCRADSAP